MVEEMKLYDKKGYPIEVGDVLKVFHFVAAVRREKRYMYKQVKNIMTNDKGNSFFIISHLNISGSTYNMLIDNGTLLDYEIVQGKDYDRRERRKNET
jgi:glutaminase